MKYRTLAPLLAFCIAGCSQISLFPSAIDAQQSVNYIKTMCEPGEKSNYALNQYSEEIEGVLNDFRKCENFEKGLEKAINDYINAYGIYYIVNKDLKDVKYYNDLWNFAVHLDWAIDYWDHINSNFQIPAGHHLKDPQLEPRT